MRHAITRTMPMFAAGIALLIQANDASGQRVRTKEPLVGAMESGGIAGCYDPARVSPAARNTMKRLGAQPCATEDASSVDVPQAPPSSDLRPFNRRWYASDFWVGVEDSGDINLTLRAFCADTPLKPYVGIEPMYLMRVYGEKSPASIEYKERKRLFPDESVLTLDVMGSRGQKLATMIFNRRGQMGSANFWRDVSRAELNALRASSYIIASTSVWRTRFTGTGAAAALSGLQC